jgi:hypothetical protein
MRLGERRLELLLGNLGELHRTRSTIFGDAEIL